MSENLSLLHFSLGKQIGLSFKLALSLCIMGALHWVPAFLQWSKIMLCMQYIWVLIWCDWPGVQNKDFSTAKKMHSLWLCFDMKQTANPAIDRGMRAWEFVSDSLTVPVCLCLYMWPIAACSNELWYELLCSINLLIQRPLCTTKLNPVQ